MTSRDGAVGWVTALQAVSIPDSVIGIFHWHNPSVRTTALGSTQPLNETSTRNLSWRVRAADAWGCQSNHSHVLTVLKPGSLNHLEPSVSAQECTGFALPLPLHGTYVTTHFTVWSVICLQEWVLVIICGVGPVYDGRGKHIPFYQYDCHRQCSKGQMPEAWLTTREIE
jgi:hypothetical protein